MATENLLGTYLKARRARLDPKTFGFASRQRRTSGLRREEVAQRANISVTWYTWLEQGRGGAPSTDVLERISSALALTPVEREHLFLLAQHRLPTTRYQPAQPVSPRLQSVLDSMELCPALVKNSTWDIVGWNHVATKVLLDYPTMPPEERNILRLMFLHPRCLSMPNWQSHARFVVAAFRLDSTRAAASRNGRAKALVGDLLEESADFAAMWSDNAVSAYGEGTKHFIHPIAGALAFEYSAFSVDGQPELGMVIYTPATAEDAQRVRALLDSPA